METRKILKALNTGAYIFGVIIFILIIIGYFIDYPEWLENLLSNILMVTLGLLILYRGYQIRNSDRQFAMIYLIIGIVLCIVPLLSFTFIKIIAVAAMVFFLLTNRRVRNIINKKDENPNS